MECLTKANTLTLPGKLLYKAPTCWSKDRLWFDKEPHNWDFDFSLERALVASCIRENRCPTIAEWAHFCVSGAFKGKIHCPAGTGTLGLGSKLGAFQLGSALGS